MVAQIDGAYLRTRPGRAMSRLLSYALFEGRPLTTKGRWINPLVFAQFGLLTRLPQFARVEAPVFILGTGRSGTTILGVVLSMHPDVGFLNEPKALWHALHPGEDLIGSYSRGPARYRLGAADASEAMRRDIRRLYGGYLRLTGNRRVVDKYPELIFRVDLVRALFPDARFLFLSRAGSDTCASIDGWSDRLGTEIGGEVHDWWGADRRKWALLVDQIVPSHADLAPHADALRALRDQRAMAAVEWIVSMREGLALIEAGAPDVLHVPFERMCADPRGMLGEIAAFCRLREDPVFLDFAAKVLEPQEVRASCDLPGFLMAPFRETQARLDLTGRLSAR